MAVLSAQLPSLPQLGHACPSLREVGGGPGRLARLPRPFRLAAAEVDGQRAARSGMGMELHYNPLPKPSQHCSKPRLIPVSAITSGRVLAESITSSVIAICFTFHATPRNTDSCNRSYKEHSFKGNIVILAEN